MKEGIDMYNTPTSEAVTILKQIQVDLKAHYRDHLIKRDEYLLSKANLAQDAGEEEQASAIRNIKKAERRNQFIEFFVFTREQEYQHRQLIEYKFQSHGKRCKNKKNMPNLNGKIQRKSIKRMNHFGER